MPRPRPSFGTLRAPHATPLHVAKASRTLSKRESVGAHGTGACPYRGPTTRPAPAYALAARPRFVAERPDLVRELPDADRLGQVAVEADAEQPIAIAGHRLGGQGDDTETGRGRVGPQASQRRLAAQVRQLDVHQDQVWAVL